MSSSEMEREAVHGRKMIEVKVRFWTNGIAEGEGKIIPKECWDAGVVRLTSNKSHDITPQKPIMFHSLMDITAKIEKALMSHGIKLHLGSRNRKLYKTK